MVELVVAGVVNGLAVCPATGNLLLLAGNNLLCYRYSLVTNPQSKTKYLDFQECLTIQLSYTPASTKIVEDTVACLTPSMVHIFKVKIQRSGEESQLHSLSSYSP